MFRDDFVWGVASSSYQIEGTDPADGRGVCVWDKFTEGGAPGTRGQNAQRTCDHMHRYKEDYALMRELGIKAYRFSVSWPRILPQVFLPSVPQYFEVDSPAQNSLLKTDHITHKP